MNKSMESNGEAGVGPRIGWVREYPSELRFRALEQVRLSAQPQTKPTIRVSPRPSPKATSVEWAFLLTGLYLEILSLAFDQASSPSKPHYALLGMILAIAAVLICIWELIYKAVGTVVVVLLSTFPALAFWYSSGLLWISWRNFPVYLLDCSTRLLPSAC